MRSGKVIEKIPSMPIFFTQDIDRSTRLAIWKITEPEVFFLEHVPLQRGITHPHKRLQHLAGRFLLQTLFPEFPISLIKIADTRKPFLPDEAFHFSISHCGQFAAAIVSRNCRVGIDVEQSRKKIGTIVHKFLSDEEQILLKEQFDETDSVTLGWSCKEAMFKWFGKGGVDFKKHMHITSLRKIGNDSVVVRAIFSKESPTELQLSVRFFHGISLAFVVTDI